MARAGAHCTQVGKGVGARLSITVRPRFVESRPSAPTCLHFSVIRLPCGRAPLRHREKGVCQKSYFVTVYSLVAVHSTRDILNVIQTQTRFVVFGMLTGMYRRVYASTNNLPDCTLIKSPY